MSGVLILTAGTLLTLGLLVLQGYWIYFDEKSKGTLCRKISFYDRLHSVVSNNRRLANNPLIRLIQPVVSEEKDSNR